MHALIYVTEAFVHAPKASPNSPFFDDEKYRSAQGGSGKNPGNVWYIFPNQSKITPPPYFFHFFGFFAFKIVTPTHIFPYIASYNQNLATPTQFFKCVDVG